jgi:uncharacterized protein
VAREATEPLGGGGMARIDHYGFGRIVVDGGEETNDLILLPDRVVWNWWRQDGHALLLDDLVEILDDLPSHLVVGTGADGWRCGSRTRMGCASASWRYRRTIRCAAATDARFGPASD